MKKAKKPRPKISIRLSVASKKLAKQGLNKVALTLMWLPLKNGDTTLTIDRSKLKAVKKKHRKRKELRQLIGKIGWIFFEALAVFFMNYFLFKMLS